MSSICQAQDVLSDVLRKHSFAYILQFAAAINATFYGKKKKFKNAI